jgi:hypothetical protein
MFKSALTTLFLFIQLSILASHIRGGEIETTFLSIYAVKVKLILYTDIRGVLQTTSMISFGDGTYEIVSITSENLIDSGVSKLEFVTTKKYSAPGIYAISFSENYRNSGIRNSSYIPFYVKTEFTIDPLRPNKGKNLEYSEELFFKGNVNQVFKLYAGAYNSTGEKLIYELIAPQASENQSVSNYVFPNMVGSSLGEKLAIDSTTGIITWDSPKQVGFYSLAVRIKQYINDQYVGECIRDFTISINSHNPIQVSEVFEVNKIDSSGYYIQSGDSLIVEYKISRNPEYSQIKIVLTVTGELLARNKNVVIFIDSLSNSSVRLANITSTSTTMKVLIVADSSLFRKNAYVTNLRYSLFDASGTIYSKDFAFKMYVQDPNVDYTTNIIDFSNMKELSIFPNPTTEVLNVNNPSSGGYLQLYDSNGKIAIDYQLKTGLNSLQLSHLLEGVYFYKFNRTSGKVLIGN